MSKHFRGGFRIEGSKEFLGVDGWSCSHQFWPFATLNMDNDGVTIKWPFREISFQMEHISSFGFFRYPWGWGGIRLYHNHKDYPSFVMFTTFSAQRLRLSLIQLGLEFTDHGHMPKEWWNPRDE